MATKNTLRLQLITPVETLFNEDVQQVIVPTTSGQITVLPHHSRLVSILAPGELIVTNGANESALAVSGGMIEMTNNTLTVLADSAEQPSEIDLEKAEERAKELAAELSQEQKMDIASYHLLQRQLEIEQARLSIGRKWRKLPPPSSQ